MGLLVPFGYALAYAYEAGTASYWGIPAILISVTWEETLAALAALLGASIVLFGFSDFFFYIPKHLRDIRVVPFLYALLLVSFAFYLLGFPIVLVLLLAGMTALVAAVEFGLPALFDRHLPYMERLRKSATSRPHPSSIGALMDRFGHNLVAVVLSLFLVLLLTLILGAQQAHRQQEFWALPGNPEEILLAKYGDTLVFGLLGKKDNLLPSIVVEKSSDHALNLLAKHIGHLTTISGDADRMWTWPFLKAEAGSGSLVKTATRASATRVVPPKKRGK